MTDFTGGCDRVVLLVELDLKERQVVKNWSGKKMCLLGIPCTRYLLLEQTIENTETSRKQFT